MNNTNTTSSILAAGAAMILLLAALALAIRLTGFSTYEMAFAFLVLAVLGSLGISEFRKGAPRRGTRVSLHRLPRQSFWV